MALHSMRQDTSHIRAVATAIAMVMALWSTALCLAASTPHVASHACCAKTVRDGAQLTALTTCCAEDAPNYYAVTDSADESLTPPAVTIVGAIAPLPHLDVVVTVAPDVLRPPGPPTYVLVSTFRL